MSEPLPTWIFSVVVVRLRDRYLLVQEHTHGMPWYLPAGRVERLETFAEAAVRETLEESNVLVALDGVLRVEHTPTPNGARCRVFFLAHPMDEESPPLSSPNEHCMAARWVTFEELDSLSL